MMGHQRGVSLRGTWFWSDVAPVLADWNILWTGCCSARRQRERLIVCLVEVVQCSKT